jgi:hypothetical protein
MTEAHHHHAWMAQSSLIRKPRPSNCFVQKLMLELELELHRQDHDGSSFFLFCGLSRSIFGFPSLACMTIMIMGHGCQLGTTPLCFGKLLNTTRGGLTVNRVAQAINDNKAAYR